MAKTSGPPFGAIPIRAFADRRLAELHLRMLGIISYHDRMSLVKGAGQGCWASSATMAEEVGGYNITNVSTAINELEKWAYIQIERRPGDRRLRVYRVLFDDPNTLPQGQTTDDSNHLPAGQTTTGAPNGDHLPVGKQSQKVVCPRDWSSDGNCSENSLQYISRSEVIDSAEAVKRNSDEPARFAARETRRGQVSSIGEVLFPEREKEGAEAPATSEWILTTRLPRNFPSLVDGAKLARLEKAFDAIGRDADRMCSRERASVAGLLTAIAEANIGENDAIVGQANRLWEVVAPF